MTKFKSATVAPASRGLTCLMVALCVVMASCGTSIYKPVGKSKSDEAKKEDAILALNNDDYEQATARLGELWDKSKSNEIAQLYAIALVGKAGINLFKSVTDALTADSASSSADEKSSAGNKVLDKISNLIPDLSDAQLAEIKYAIDVLQAAPNQTSTGLKFQKCLVAGIYAAPALAGITTTVAKIQTTLNALPAKLGTSTGSNACTASADAENQAGQELSDVITAAGKLASRVTEISAIVGACLPAGSGEAVNEVTAKVTKLKTNADKGCAIPATQTIGAFTLPSCMNTFISSGGGATAVASDGLVAGCEVFLNCSDGKCFQ